MFVLNLITCSYIYIGVYTNDPKAVMPYKYISKYGIAMDGLPEGIILKPPSSYGLATLKEIIARKDLLRVTCMSTASC